MAWWGRQCGLVFLPLAFDVVSDGNSLRSVQEMATPYEVSKKWQLPTKCPRNEDFGLKV